MAGRLKKRSVVVTFASMIPSLAIMATHWSDTVEMARMTGPAIGQALLFAMGIGLLAGLAAGATWLARQRSQSHG